MSSHHDSPARPAMAQGRWRGPGARLLSVALALVASMAGAGVATFDLRPDWDSASPLANPDKGWYHHLLDNSPRKYAVESDKELTAVPGMDHVYLRIAWSHLEPREGHFRWWILDEPIARWTSKGLGVAFRISCKETSDLDLPEQVFATPRWVRDAGAKGGHWSYGQPAADDRPWEPDYGDPVFLDKLDAFLAAFATRYDGRPWVRYVDIGSFGDWGEGHTWAGSRRKFPYEVLERHVDLHLRHIRRSQLVISDDYVASLESPEDRRRFHEKILRAGISYRDDSILVDGYVRGLITNSTVRMPHLFADAAIRTPTVLELEHYGTVKRLGNWIPRPDSALGRYGGGRSGADVLRGALELLRATWIGYHGYAREWLADNPALTVELLNRCGYWYFPERVEATEPMSAGRTNTVAIVWRNRGVAPAYRSYDLHLRLVGPATFTAVVPSGNTRWRPDGPAEGWLETYGFALPADLPAGRYELQFKLHAPVSARDVRLALHERRRRADGFYAAGELSVTP